MEDSAMKTALPPSPVLTSAHKIKDSTCVDKTALRSGNLVTAPAPTMITSTCVETSAQSLPAPAATQSVVLTPAVPASSHSYLMERHTSHVSPQRKIPCCALPRWTVLVSFHLHLQTMASAMLTALPTSPDQTSAHQSWDSTCVDKTA